VSLSKSVVAVVVIVAPTVIVQDDRRNRKSQRDGSKEASSLHCGPICGMTVKKRVKSGIAGLAAKTIPDREEGNSTRKRRERYENGHLSKSFNKGQSGTIPVNILITISMTTNYHIYHKGMCRIM
jgi:hypothetical protein